MDDPQNWKTVATGWSEISKYLQSNKAVFRQMFGTKDKLFVAKNDVDNYVGKDWEWKTSYGYLRRLKLSQEDFMLQIYKYNKHYG